MSTVKKRVALYARVSTSDQDPTMQLDELRTYADRRGWPIVGEYVDQGESGAKDRRPHLDALMARVRRGGVGCRRRLEVSLGSRAAFGIW